MLETDERGMVARALQCVEHVLFVIAEREAAVRQAEHAVTVRAHAGEQAGAAGEHVGAALKAFRKTTPPSASRCKLGAGTAWPYGCR
ncbi:MAG TPA: hypothetical protein VKJ01_22325 [Candidatus Solibacter sp.]|nr:hypothetical protein [Candidatus Solibacter sp.]